MSTAAGLPPWPAQRCADGSHRHLRAGRGGCSFETAQDTVSDEGFDHVKYRRQMDLLYRLSTVESHQAARVCTVELALVLCADVQRMRTGRRPGRVFSVQRLLAGRDCTVDIAALDAVRMLKGGLLPKSFCLLEKVDAVQQLLALERRQSPSALCFVGRIKQKDPELVSVTTRRQDKRGRFGRLPSGWPARWNRTRIPEWLGSTRWSGSAGGT